MRMSQKMFKSAISLIRGPWSPMRTLHTRFPLGNQAQIEQNNATNQTASAVPETQVQPTARKFLLSKEDEKDFFRLNEAFTIQDLMTARVHFGHKEGMLNPHMRPFIFGSRLGVHIIDLDKTSEYLNYALQVVAEFAYREGIILFVHNSRQNGHLVEDLARECAEFAVCKKWDDRILTDSSKMFGSVVRLPDLVVLFSTLSELNESHKAIKSSAKMLIPTVAICDTNSDPTLITYPVPGNDDTPQSIELYCKLFKTAVLNGKAKRKDIIARYGEELYYETIRPIEGNSKNSQPGGEQ